jgi:hypothetical protein
MQPIAIPIMGGMAVSLVTIFIVSDLYCMVFERRLRRSLTAETPLE